MIFHVLGLVIGLGIAAAQTGDLVTEPLPVERPDVWGLLLGSGWMVRLVLLVLLATSIGCWGIALAKGREMRRARRQSARFIDVFWEAKNLSTIQAASGEMKSSPVAQVFRAGYQELQRLTRAKRGAAEDDESEFGRIETVPRAMQRARTQEVTRLERGLTFLATTAGTAPFVGLFGTVWGMITALMCLSGTAWTSMHSCARAIAVRLAARTVA